MNTAVYQRKELTFESTRKKVDSVGTMAVSYIVFMNTSVVLTFSTKLLTKFLQLMYSTSDFVAQNFRITFTLITGKDCA